MKVFGLSFPPAAAVLAAVLVSGPLCAQAVRAGFNAQSLSRNDDDSSSAVAMGFEINFFGNRYSNAFVNNNGNLTFEDSLAAFTPQSFGTLGVPMIAPFWADVDTSNPASGVVQYGTGTIDGRRAFGATYRNVGYFPGLADKLNTFQVILIDRGGGDFDIEFNYDSVMWETGDASGGEGGLGGNSACVGYTNGSNTTFELPGCRTPGSFLNGGPRALNQQRINSTVAGRLVFTARNGTVVTPPPSVSATCVNFPAGFVPFQSIAYVSQASAAGQRLVVGSLGSAFSDRLRTIQQIPFPSETDQMFCGQVRLGPGQLFDAFVPTAAERAGDFSAFAGQLLDPRSNNQPFPSGIIPANRIGDIFAWRIKVASPADTSGIYLSQTGLTFQGTAGGPPPPSRDVTVLSTAGGVAFTATARTLGPGGWLSIAVAAPGRLRVTANPAALPAGDYYGDITIVAPGAANSPLTVTAVLNVVANASPLAEPTGLVFTSPPNGAPAPQAITVTNLSRSSTTFTTSTVFPRGAWFTLSPSTASVPSGTPAQVTVNPTVAGLPVGVYPATTTFRFGDGSQQQVSLVLVVAPGGGSGTPAAKREAHGACTPSSLIPVSTLLPPSFNTATAWPTPLEALVVDDCGHAITSNELLVTFNNGDSPVSMTHIANGRWTGTWTPRNARNADLIVSLDAVQSSPLLRGTTSLFGSARANPEVPSLVAGGLLGAASFTGPPAPGALATLFGGRLSDGSGLAAQLPLPVLLHGTNLFLAGRAVPLVFSSDGQVNVVVPYDVPPGVRVPLIARRGNRQSAPEMVRLAEVQPAVFTVDLSGQGQGHIYIARPSGQQPLADVQAPAAAGDVLVVYSSGLGAVTPPVAAGVAVPFDRLTSTANPVTATIGGRGAQVSFAGLTPGFTGLYQVNVVVPAGIPAGPAELVLTVLGVSSPPVTLHVR